eukprot:g1918.t1
MDIGGQRFATYLSVLQSPKARGTVLGALFSGRHELEEKGEPVFIDRDPFVFRYILNYLRNPKACRFPDNVTEQDALFDDAQYYCLPHDFFCACSETGSCLIEGGPVPSSYWRGNQIVISGAGGTPSDDTGWLALMNESLPSNLHFDGKSSGSITFQTALPLCGLEVNNGNGMSFEIQAQEEGKWVCVASMNLTSNGWNAKVSWAPRQKTPQSWKLVLKKNTSDRYLQAFRWYQLQEQRRPWCARFPRDSIPKKEVSRNSTKG